MKDSSIMHSLVMENLIFKAVFMAIVADAKQLQAAASISDVFPHKLPRSILDVAGTMGKPHVGPGADHGVAAPSSLTTDAAALPAATSQATADVDEETELLLAATTVTEPAAALSRTCFADVESAQQDASSALEVGSTTDDVSKHAIVEVSNCKDRPACPAAPSAR